MTGAKVPLTRAQDDRRFEIQRAHHRLPLQNSVVATWQGLSILITGATGGIGRLAAAALAEQGARVLVHGRSPDRVNALVGELSRAGARLSGLVADLSSLAETANLAHAALAASDGALDVLINNAGIGFGSDRRHRETSRDGIELRFAVNYLAPFVLTRTLLAQQAPARPVRTIVNVASIGQEAIDLDDLQTARDYDGVRAYRRSKLALIMFTFDLAAELDRVTVNALHPGSLLDTGMVRDAGIRPLGPAKRGVEVIAHVLSAAIVDRTTGAYFDELRPARADPQAYDLAVRRGLRERTLALVGRFLPQGR